MLTTLLLSLTAATAQSQAVQEPAGDAAERSRAIHALNRLTYGPRPGDVDRVLATGVEQFIEQQLQAPPDRTVEGRVKRMSVSDLSNHELGSLYDQLTRDRRARQEAGDTTRGPLQTSSARAFRQAMSEFEQITMMRAVSSERQLYEIMVDFWTNHFNVFSGKGPVRFLVRDHVERVIRPHALGRFEDLLLATAQSPAMLVYLDNVNSVAPGSVPLDVAAMRDRLERSSRNSRMRPNQRQRVRDAQARMERLTQRLPSGLNENYARELLELHTLGVDGGYSQEDVVGVARILTGWSADLGPRPGTSHSFQFNAWAHDGDPKTVLEIDYHAPGMEEGIALIQVLAQHPATQRHVTGKLCARFVSDVATEGCLQSGTAAWRATNGDIQAVLRAILSSPDFWAVQHRNAKTKTPMEFVVSAIRALDAHPDSTQLTLQMMRRLGQPLFGQTAPTGYPETQDEWVNAGALLNRLNIGLAIASPRARGLGIDLNRIVAATATTDEMVREINHLVLNDQASPNTLRVMRERGAGIGNGMQRRAFLVSLALGSPEFQRQ